MRSWTAASRFHSHIHHESRRNARVGRGIAILALLGAVLLNAEARSAEPAASLLLATTTSVRDSGLLESLLPDFTKRTGIKVRVIAVGTGAALRMGREGNADLLLTHAPSAEQVLVDDGIVRRRTPFMENHFVIAGPPKDPIGVASTKSPEAALQAIARAEGSWVSRADDSGTHKREVSLLEAAGLPPDASWKGYVRTGSGMGLSLQVAGEKRAYILSDIGTFLAFQQRIDLVALSKRSDSLRNVYSLLQLDATKFEHPLHTEEAEALEDYLLTPATLERIGEFGRDRFGRALFTPIKARPSRREEVE
jgi:tungstate transport system substrate-binding protein